jgi:AcrR family transcriptional regulator
VIAEAALAPVHNRRLRSRDRRRQIVRVASDLLALRGVDHVRIPEVAASAGVTRAVVYRFFPSRQALLGAVLEDFRRDLEQRFAERAALLRGARRVTNAIVQSFVMACCDAIDAAGAGGFILLNMDGPDPELASMSRATRAALNQPWLARVANVTRASGPMLSAVSAMAVASSRAVLTLYIERRITREQAVEALARGTRALLAEFRD